MRLTSSSVWLVALLGIGCSQRTITPIRYAKPAAIEEVGPLIEAAAAQGPAALGRYIDWSAVGRRAVPPEMGGLERAGFQRGLVQTLEETSGPRLMEALQQGYTYRGVAWRNGRPVARFRLLPPEGGFNFHDLVIAFNREGEPRVVDLHFMTTHQYLSVSMRHAARGSMQGISTEQAERVSEFSGLVVSGPPEEALRRYDALPARVQASPDIQLMRVQAASGLDDDERYLRVLDDVARRFPDHPALQATMLDAYVLREEWAQCFHSIDTLRGIYPDPYFDAFESRLRTMSGDPDRGLELADLALEAEPGSIDGRDAALFAALALGRTERAHTELTILVERHEVDAMLLADQPGYEGVRELLVPGSALPP